MPSAPAAQPAPPVEATAASAPPEAPARVVDDDLEDILARLGDESAEQPGHSADAAPSDEPGPSTSRPATGDKLTDPRDLARPSSASKIVVDVGSGLEFDPSFASFGQRAASAIIDTVVVTVAVLPGLLILQAGSSFAVTLLGMIVGLVGLLVVVALGARALATNGKWIGNRVTGTTVVDAINGSFIDQGRGALRMLGRHVISPIFLFGYLIAFADGQRRTFHDRLVGTVVIRRTREVWNADDATP